MNNDSDKGVFGGDEKTTLEAQNLNLADLVEVLRRENESLKISLSNQKTTIETLLNELDKRSKKLTAAERTIEVLKDLAGKEELDKNLVDFLNRQKRIFQNKVNHGFNVTNIYQEARYILEETAELMRAIEKNDRENMIEELADIVIFAYGCTEVARLGDLDTKIFEKMKLNESREYTQNSEGDFVKVIK